MKNSVTHAYQKNWKKKILEKDRISSQERVYCTFSKLFTEILHESFSGAILDIGCGDGALVELLNTKKGISCTGIDIDRGVDFEKDKLPYNDGVFDIIVMYSVIEHLYDPGNLLNEIKRICKTNGKIIIITSNFDLTNFITFDRFFYNDPTHVHPYDYISIESLMGLYGMKKRFIGLWTVKKSTLLWKLPLKLQFYIGALLPFRGQTKLVPSLLKGKSRSMLCVFENE